MRLSLFLSLLVLLAGCDSKPSGQAPPLAAAPAAPLPAPSPTPAPPAAPADSLATFSWEDEACTNRGTYDPRLYTRQQLADTRQLVVGFELLPTAPTFRLVDYTDEGFRQAAARLKQTHDSLAPALHRLRVVPVPFWQKFKHLRELQLAEQYEQGQLELAGYFAPASLRQSRYYAACPTYADALAATDTAVVLRAWRQLIAEQKAGNGVPEQFDEEYAAALASPDGLRHAKMRLLGFGWHNCMNRHSKYSQLEDQYQPHTKFDKLFRRVQQSGCVDVD